MRIEAIRRALPTLTAETLAEIEAVIAGGHAPRALTGRVLLRAERTIKLHLRELHGVRDDRSGRVARCAALVESLARLDPHVSEILVRTHDRREVISDDDARAIVAMNSARSVLVWLRLRSGALGSPHEPQTHPTRDARIKDGNLVGKLIRNADD